MTRDGWERLKTVFQDALDQPTESRHEWILRACGGDAELLREAEALLEAHGPAGDFLERPAVLDPTDVLNLVESPEPSEPHERHEPDAPPAPLWQPGTRLGAYEVVEEIGRGGMGVVYLAEDTKLGRLIALKSLPAEFANRTELRERLRREARAAANITHPSVATVYALEEVDGHLLIVSEYVRGSTLRSLIERGPIEPVRARSIARDIAGALDAAHQVGVVHRDLKPENVIISTDGGAKVVDFGIAHLEGTPMTRLTRAGAMLGTPAYMAPEQLLGASGDARTDIYALGVLMLEMLSGRHPLTKSSTSTPSERREDALVSIATRCAQADPSARYASARDVLRDLDRGAAIEAGRNRARWWWEFHQVAAAIAYVVILVPAWRARESIGGLPGRMVFMFTAAAVIVTALLRLHLWFTSRLHPSELDWARARERRWIYAADWLLVGSLVASAVLVGERSALDIVLIATAIGTAVAFLMIEPATARGAFGELASASSKVEVRMSK